MRNIIIGIPLVRLPRWKKENTVHSILESLIEALIWSQEYQTTQAIIMKEEIIQPPQPVPLDSC